MTCREDRLVTFLAGELPDDQAREMDQHLLSCEACWKAAREDRSARLALELLREPAPPGLADRVAAAVGLAAAQDQPRRAHRRPSGSMPDRRARGAGRGRTAGGLAGAVRRHPLRALAGVAVAAGALAAGLTAVALAGSPAVDPAPIAGIAAMARHHLPAPGAGGEQMVVGGQEMDVRSYRVERTMVVVATSRQAFPMPRVSHMVAGSSHGAWMATSGALSMYCVNRPAGHSMLVVAAMPAADLPGVAVRLHLS